VRSHSRETYQNSNAEGAPDDVGIWRVYFSRD
jgi:hypothetical protein